MSSPPLASPREAKTGDAASSGGRRSLPEMVTLLVSIAVVFGLTGYLGWHGLALENKAPLRVVATVHRDRATKQADGTTWIVPVEVRSLCDTPVEEVQATVEWVGADGQKDEAEISVDYLAERGRETTFVMMDQVPSKATPKATVKTFRARQKGRGY